MSWLIAQLREQPRRFGFVPAVRALGGDVESLRLQADYAMGFPAAEVRSCDGRELLVAPLALGGSGSPLPACYAEDLAGLDATGTAGGLIGLIQHRLLALLYRSLTHHRPVDDPAAFARLVAGLGGCADVEMLPFAGLLAAPPSAAALERIAAARIGAPVAVEQCSPRWCALPAAGRPGLGAVRLGVDAITGARVLSRSTGFRVEIGPVGWMRAESFRRGGEGLEQVRRCIAAIDRDGLDHRIDLVIATADVPASPLGAVALGSHFRLAGTPADFRRETVYETD